MLDDVVLRVNGMNYGGWTSVRITRSMEALAGSFELAVTDRWIGQNIGRPIKKGDACAVLVNDVPVITGYVDDRLVSYDKEQHSITITGRDKTADLVDCTLPDASYAYQTLAQIATAVCDPFGISVITDTDVGKPFEKWHVETGETPYETLSKAAAHRGLLLLSDGLGALLITKAGSAIAPASLRFGQNIETCSVTQSQRDQFSIYTVRNQVGGSDLFSGEQAAEVKATSTDTTVKRYRPASIHADAGTDIQQRADYERNVRAGKANRFIYTVSSWLANGSTIWPLNQLLPVTDPNQEPKLHNTELLIAGVTFVRDENGSSSELSLLARGAFDLLATPETASSGEFLF